MLSPASGWLGYLVMLIALSLVFDRHRHCGRGRRHRPMTFLERFPVALLITLVSAAILRKPKVLPASA